MEINTLNLSGVSTQELLRRLEASNGVDDTYRMIVEELQSRGIDASIPKTE